MNNIYYRRKFRVPSIRAQWWNYANEAAYFITINTKNKFNYFGEITDAQINLKPIGKILDVEWQKTPDLRPDMKIHLGEYCVMPDHFHAIIIIGQHKPACSAILAAQKQRSTANNYQVNQHHFGPQSNNISSIIRGLKAAVTSKARKIEPEFTWQSRFYDHIIRDDDSYQKIVTYIKQNPINWKKDDGSPPDFLFKSYVG